MLRSFELPGIARLGALAQGSLACAQPVLRLAELGMVALRGRELAGSTLVCCVCLRTLAADAVMRRLGLTQARGAPPAGDLRVAPVGPQVDRGGVARLDHRRQCAAVLLKAAKRLRDVGDQRLIDGRQRLGERI